MPMKFKQILAAPWFFNTCAVLMLLFGVGLGLLGVTAFQAACGWWIVGFQTAMLFVSLSRSWWQRRDIADIVAREAQAMRSLAQAEQAMKDTLVQIAAEHGMEMTIRCGDEPPPPPRWRQ